jgi:hypothetical protein
MARSLCIHGHFYQPPREDPFTGQIPKEAGAEPWDNFNQKITAECYQPNVQLGNFERISFNVGPTLLEWFQKSDLETYEGIIRADEGNVQKYGVGNALAQPYNHTILPLATEREKQVQVKWGIADFQARFGRTPDGMWLPETAVDYATLEVLVSNDIRFVILAPWQADDPSVDTSEPYLVSLPSGRSITVFFYDAHLSGKIRPDPRTPYGAREFVRFSLPMRLRLSKVWSGDDQLLLLASDGEHYGHGVLGRERFLHEVVYREAFESGYQVTSLPVYLLQHPPIREVNIREDTAWSCRHGIERWRGHCDCIGEGTGEWKGPLRHALIELAQLLDSYYETVVASLNLDHAQLLCDYIGVRSGWVDREEFLAFHDAQHLSDGEFTILFTLLESQYYRQIMFTSCGFFFEDFDRIEPKNNVKYAAKAITLAEEVTKRNLREQFSDGLAQVKSWRTSENGRDYFEGISRLLNQ